MKKNLKLKGKLSFQKHVIANLADAQMQNILGGATLTTCGQSDSIISFVGADSCTVQPTLRPPTRGGV